MSLQRNNSREPLLQFFFFFFFDARIGTSFHCSVILHCMGMLHFVYPSSVGGRLGYLSPLNNTTLLVRT